MIGYNGEGLKKYEIQEDLMVKITSLKDSGSFSEILYHKARNSCFAFECEERVIYEVSEQGKLT